MLSSLDLLSGGCGSGVTSLKKGILWAFGAVHAVQMDVSTSPVFGWTRKHGSEGRPLALPCASYCCIHARVRLNRQRARSDHVKALLSHEI